MKFRSRNEHELSKFSDEKLVEYMVAARDAGHRDAMKDAIGIFSYKREHQIKARIASKRVPVSERDQVFMEVIASSLTARFKGVSTGEMVNLIKTITKFRIADYFEKNKNDLDAIQEPDQAESGKDSFLEPGEEIGSVEISMLIDAELDKRSRVHRKIIELRIEGYSSKEIAVIVNEAADLETADMNYVNVDTIFSRFRKDLKKIIESEDGSDE